MNISINGVSLDQLFVNQIPENTGKKEQSADSFGDFLNSASNEVTKNIEGTSTKEKPAEPVKEKTEKTDNTNTSKTEEKDNSKEDSVETNVSDKKDTDSKEDLSSKNLMEIPEEVLEVAAESLITQVAEILDIPVETVEEAVKDIVEVKTDLLDPAATKELAMELLDCEDSVELVSDGEKYEKFTEVAKTLEKINTDIKSVESREPEKEVVVSVEKTDKLPVTDNKVAEVKKPDVEIETKTDIQMEVKAEPESETEESSEDGLFNNSFGSQKKTETPAQTKHNPLVSFNEEIKGTAQEIINEAQALKPETSAKVEYPEIINQIVERIKVTSTEDVQEITMRLHPENLGNLQIKLSAVNGQITATFTAENESVKNTIESQLIVLKEQFEENGTKVTDIEVNVSAGQLAQDFAGNDTQAGTGSEAKKRAPRRINLGELTDEDIEALTKDERIAADMMAANGNTLDVTA